MAWSPKVGEQVDVLETWGRLCRAGREKSVKTL